MEKGGIVAESRMHRAEWERRSSEQAPVSSPAGGTGKEAQCQERGLWDGLS